MKLTPTADRVLIKRQVREERTPGGLYIPATAHDDHHSARGAVISIGPKVISLHVGDQVLLPKYAGQEVNIDDVAHQLIPESEVLGVVEE